MTTDGDRATARREKSRIVENRKQKRGMIKSGWSHSGTSSDRVSLTPPFMGVLERLEKLNPFKGFSRLPLLITPLCVPELPPEEHSPNRPHASVVKLLAQVTIWPQDASISVEQRDALHGRVFRKARAVCKETFTHGS